MRRVSARRVGRDVTAMRNHNPEVPEVDNQSNFFAAKGGTYTDPRGQFSLTMPNGWTSRPAVVNGEMQFRVYTPDGRTAGQAALAAVAESRPLEGSTPARRKAIGGVPFTELRRRVIDKMVAGNGWVVNDFEREIGGRKVFVVQAQTAASSDGRTPPQAWTFYFTEAEGRVYSVATSAPLEYSDRMATESEQVMASFRGNNQATLSTAPQR